jgi:inner membrane protein
VDNLTHALAGMLTAEAAAQLRSSSPSSSERRVPPAPSWRSVAYVASVAGNNLPDLDFLWSGVTARPFGYLLHHRGYSHTLPAALACTLLLLAGVFAFAERRREAWSRADIAWMAVLCFVAPLTHIAMDSSNNYGTHPFWPFYDGWIYGDAVFIVEPFFWAAGIPPLVFAARSSVTRITLIALLAFGVGAAFFVPFVPAPMSALLAAVAVACTAAAWRASPPVRALLGVGACLGVAAMFFVASHKAVRAVLAALSESSPSELVDVVVTPMPANPFCFTALTVEDDENYIARRATVAPWASLFSVDKCPDTEEHPTARFLPGARPSTRYVHWRGEYVAPLAELRALYRDNCQAAALLRFFRVPYWVPEGDGALVFGDLRYDRNPGLDFSDVRIEEKPTSCPKAVPSWRPPRHDLLGAE